MTRVPEADTGELVVPATKELGAAVPIAIVKTTVLVALNWPEAEEGSEAAELVAVNTPEEATPLGEGVAKRLPGADGPGIAGTEDRFPEAAALEDCCITIELNIAGPSLMEEFVIGEESASEAAAVPVVNTTGEVEGAVPEAAALEDCITSELNNAGPEPTTDTEDTVETEEAAGATAVVFAKLANALLVELKTTAESLAGTVPVERSTGAPDKVVWIALATMLLFAAVDDEISVSGLELASNCDTGAVVKTATVAAEELPVVKAASVASPEDAALIDELKLTDV